MNETYDFRFYFIAFLIYSTLPILILGLALSILIGAVVDRLGLRSKALHMVVILLAYAAAGFIGTFIYTAAVMLPRGLAPGWEDVRPLSVFGITAALLFAIIEYVLDLFTKNQQVKRREGAEQCE
ncbi:hypothetical protein [Paenibacillus sp. YPG26]|uniref:hypothetical protein n=1 Tax=Paenibacillus sp. YPG26 TaxID=2878915 RepID=UPI00203D9F38|nr:hypothetical protein [Paenibacillus sp. YPG26]USB33401.1 hypothetical protein LDO05_00715 [Paenibacillus sp. YPG26]